MPELPIEPTAAVLRAMHEAFFHPDSALEGPYRRERIVYRAMVRMLLAPPTERWVVTGRREDGSTRTRVVDLDSELDELLRAFHEEGLTDIAVDHVTVQP
jgi:hypothetical protein